MVRAILEGRKTQTRRILKPQPMFLTGSGKRVYAKGDFKKSWQDISGTWQGSGFPDCSHGNVGDRLWVRETWAQGLDLLSDYPSWLYRADKTARFHGYDKPGSELDTYAWAWDCVKWKPSIFMPKDASRITLEITNIRCEQLLTISESDAISEGVEQWPDGSYLYYGKNPGKYNKAYHSYQSLWDQINGEGAWEKNPFVWVIEFKRV